MSYTISFLSRDFASPVFIGLHAEPLQLAWSAFGGPDFAKIQLTGPAELLIEAAGLLRCPVTISDQRGTKVWWGVVDTITIHRDQTQIKVSLEDVFNKVKVAYSFISPDNRLGDRRVTAYASDLASQTEYGVKETVLQYADLDDVYAESLRDTFLNLHAWPKSTLSSLESPAALVELHCSGWFHTLGWSAYDNAQGFFANYGPGPGSINFGRPNWRLPSQMISTGDTSLKVKYVYFQMRRNGTAAGETYARVYSNSAATPSTILGASEVVYASTLPSQTYQWIKFTFATPVTLNAHTAYWVSAYYPVTDPVNNIVLRTDENATYFQDNHFAKYNDAGTWKFIPNITSPGTNPHLIFRVVCVADTGEQILNTATAGGQFFERITGLTTSVETCPYQRNPISAQKRLEHLMTLGTADHRMVLASVSANRHLSFYEQPDSSTPPVYITRNGRFYTFQGIPIPPAQPPVGQFAALANTARVSHPFDQHRLPTCFVRNALLNTITGVIHINNE